MLPNAPTLNLLYNGMVHYDVLIPREIVESSVLNNEVRNENPTQTTMMRVPATIPIERPRQCVLRRHQVTVDNRKSFTNTWNYSVTDCLTGPPFAEYEWWKITGWFSCNSEEIFKSTAPMLGKTCGKILWRNQTEISRKAWASITLNRDATVTTLCPIPVSIN